MVTVCAWGAMGCEKEGPETQQDFCTQYAQRECGAVAVTCARDVATCQPRRVTGCTQFISTLSATTREYRPKNAMACLDQVDATYKKALITAADFAALNAACARVIEGAAAANQACAANQDCASPLVCDKGFCGTQRQVAAGGNCANPGDTCIPDELCQAAGGVSVCMPKRDRDAGCSTAQPCKTAFRCQGTCMDKVAVGAACAADDDCQSGYCNLYPPAGVARTCLPGLSFSPFSPSCEAYFGASAPGDAGADM